ncbi:MAG: DUF11 domain-containing protein, partial [Acidimicrobiales bacterium]|nr:DUF11 domain-containing protein [Acidimicrobiales bacterium]
ATGCTPTVTLTSGQQNLTLDTGFTLLSAVGDLVWHDLDADGRQDAGEPGIQNVSVELWSVGTDNTAGTGDDVRVTQNDGVTVRPAQLTTVNGEYLFSGLLPGTYFVKVDRATLPAGYRVSPADAGADDAVDSDAVTDPTNAGRLITGTATITTDAEDLTLDTGIFLPAAIGDRVWEDVDGDGVQDGGEPDLGVDVTVTLTDCDGTPITTDVDGNPVTSTVTTQGAFRFDDIRPGTYCLQYSLPTGWERTVAGTGGDTAADSDPDVATGETAPTVLSSGEDDLTWDAGYFRPAALGDLVWFDADGDGLQDGGELPAPGVTARLRDLQGTQLATTVTDADGRYHFTGLWPGTYQVCFERPADDWFSPLDAPADDQADSDVDRATGCTIAVTLASGDVDDSLDAGIFDDVELGDVVWEDRDLDGRQDAGEPAVPGVRLVLRQPGPDAVWDSADDVPVAETTTGTDGLYRFRGLLAGTYRVSVDTATLPTAMRLTVADAAAEAGTGDDGLDSDADVATGHLTAVTVPAGTENLTLDAGLITPFALTLTKQLLGELTAGEQATYRLTVTNTGPGTAWAGLTLTDKLPVGLSFESASGVGWACQAPTSDNDIVCTSASTLAAGATDSLELIVDVGASESGVIINTATVTAAGLERLSATVPGATVAGVVATRQPLVRTGADTLRLVLWGAALILTGVALAVPARRRLRLAPVHNRRPNRD